MLAPAAAAAVEKVDCFALLQYLLLLLLLLLLLHACEHPPCDGGGVETWKGLVSFLPRGCHLHCPEQHLYHTLSHRPQSGAGPAAHLAGRVGCL
jgi:hypothetical protein